MKNEEWLKVTETADNAERGRHRRERRHRRRKRQRAVWKILDRVQPCWSTTRQRRSWRPSRQLGCAVVLCFRPLMENTLLLRSGRVATGRPVDTDPNASATHRSGNPPRPLHQPPTSNVQTMSIFRRTPRSSIHRVPARWYESRRQTVATNTVHCNLRHTTGQ